MSKVFAVHRFEPRSGASTQDFEKLVSDILSAMQLPDDWKMYVLKGDRGEQKGNYLVLHEFDSVEARNHYFPIEGGTPSEEAQQVLNLPDLTERFQQLVNILPDQVYTDYVTMGD
jgi:hypothetical protein